MISFNILHQYMALVSNVGAFSKIYFWEDICNEIEQSSRQKTVK
jgi:hypothetical protein